MKEQKVQGLTNHEAWLIQDTPPYQLFKFQNTAVETYGTVTLCEIKEKRIQRCQFYRFAVYASEQ